VMRNGVLYASETLDELWPTPRKYAPQWWIDWLPPGGRRVVVPSPQPDGSAKR
jgi:hypothetical protein